VDCRAQRAPARGEPVAIVPAAAMATLLNKPRAQAALDAWATYGSMEAAARAAGVHRSTLYRWAARGREPGAARYYRRFARFFDGRHIALLGNGVRLTKAEYDRGMRDLFAELDRQRDELLATMIPPDDGAA
jgi:hypothetical protein